MAKLTIRVIYDHCRAAAGFQEGWGFSCLVDVGRRRILFDTGADPKAFFSNLQNFDIPCEEITDVVFPINMQITPQGFTRFWAN